MTTFHEGRHSGEFLMTEASGSRSREALVMAASQTIQPGAILGKVTASGSYVALNPAATDGSETAAGIAIYPATTGAGETTKIAAIVRDAEVNTHCLIWPDGITPEAQANAIQALAAHDIIIR